MLESSTVLLVRHGEKPGDACAKDTEGDVDLSALGVERAEAYIQYFENYFATAVDGSQPEPIKLDYLFASANTGSSWRPVETLTPLAAATRLPFETDIADDCYTQAIAVLKDPKYAAANILACWHHGKIMDFANALLVVNGQPLPELPLASTWPHAYDCHTFGWALQIRYDGQGIVMPEWTRCFNEHLMPDDTIDPPQIQRAVTDQRA